MTMARANAFAITCSPSMPTATGARLAAMRMQARDGAHFVALLKGTAEFAMNWSSGLAWLAMLTARREQSFAETDRGDMGTAFGLDASIGAAGDSSPSGSPEPSQGPEPWERRIVRRSGL
jgi:hypothetical protein